MGVTVREKPKGSGVWWLFINHEGQRKSKKIGNDKKLAHDVAAKIDARLVLNEFNMDTGIKEVGPIFKEYADKALLMPRDWKDSTREVYADYLRIHVFPVFGKTDITTIKRKDLKSFFDDLLIKGLRPATVKLIKASVNVVFLDAIDNEDIENNPLSDLQLRIKKKTSPEIQPLDEYEAEQLLEQAQIFMDGFYYPAFLCLLRTGIRIGELQALTVDCLNFNDRIIEIKKSWRKKRTTRTKNRKARRIDMTPQLAEILKALRIEQKKQALKNGHPLPELVFSNKKAEMVGRIPLTNALKRCLEAAGLRHIRMHDLRHSHITMRLLRGHNVGDVSYQAGHSSIKITYDTYGHWIPGRFKSEMDELDTPLKSEANGCV